MNLFIFSVFLDFFKNTFRILKKILNYVDASNNFHFFRRQLEVKLKSLLIAGILVVILALQILPKRI